MPIKQSATNFRRTKQKATDLLQEGVHPFRERLLLYVQTFLLQEPDAALLELLHFIPLSHVGSMLDAAPSTWIIMQRPDWKKKRPNNSARYFLLKTQTLEFRRWLKRLEPYCAILKGKYAPKAFCTGLLVFLYWKGLLEATDPLSIRIEAFLTQFANDLHLDVNNVHQRYIWTLISNNAVVNELESETKN